MTEIRTLRDGRLGLRELPTRPTKVTGVKTWKNRLG